MDLNDFKSLVLKRQSCRDFTGEPLDEKDIEEVVNVALNSPSACNSQPWKLYVVSGDKKSEVLDAITDDGRNLFVEKASNFIVLSEKVRPLKKDIESRFSQDYFVKYDIGEMIAYLTLGLATKDISSCIIGWVNSDKIKKALSLEGESASIVIALGKSNIPIREKKRLPNTETVKYL